MQPSLRVACPLLLLLAACSRTPPSRDRALPAGDAGAASEAASVASDRPTLALVRGASDCSSPDGPRCLRFATPEDAFRFVLDREPAILAIGEAHAQRGTEAIPSATRRFTESLLPMVAARGASDVVVELWAPDPKCAKEVKEVAVAQKPVVEAQAETNQNEYVTLGTRAKAAGITPWLLRPTCDDFSMLADAGADSIGAMLGLVKRLTEAKVEQLYRRGRADGGRGPMVIAYGGALHNDLAPPDATRAYSFGPELDRLAEGRYVELDLIVPEYVKRSPAWEKLPWFAAFEAERRSPRGGTLVYMTGERAFVLVFPTSSEHEQNGLADAGGRSRFKQTVETDERILDP